MESDVNGRYRRGLGRAALLACGLLGLLGESAGAEEGASAWARTDQSGVRLVSSAAAVGSAEALRLGLEFELAPGWKTYWRSPGDAGFPVSVDWAGSRNLASAELAWPAPHRFSLFGLDTFGYETAVVLPVTARLEQPGQAASLRAKVDYLICEEICIPYTAELALDLPAGAANPTGFAQLIDRYVAKVPGDGARHGLRLDRVAVGGTAENPALEIVARSELAPFARPDVMIEGPSGLYFAAPVVQMGDGGRVANLTVPVAIDDDAPALDRAELTLTLVDGERGLEQRLTPQAGGAPAAGGFSAGLLPILLLALLGGLVLNVMPCVLPVLSLKLLGLIGHDAGDGGRVRIGFLASAAGIVTTFVALAAALIALKQAGGAIGWGIQFQQPWFLIAMTLLLTVFAANLWGWLEVPLPGWIGRLAASPTSGGVGGQFATGVFATLLATPCSAPFVGTAIGFALARGPGDIVAVFLALGLGFAAPYLLVAALPEIARLLPRPGRWMLVVRRILGLLLAGTAVWLLTILSAQIAPAAGWLVVALVAAIAALLWARHRLPVRFKLASPLAVGLLAVIAFVAPQFGPSRATTTAVAADWQPFDQGAIAELVADGRTVLVDVTADWCVTCLVNKRFVLESAEIVDALAAGEVVAMQADWTRPDDAIARYLASHGRYGIPFNAVYGPGAPDGLLLPELLNQDAVIEALREAGGTVTAGD
jgi:suppressor for copper-sensitivity B